MRRLDAHPQLTSLRLANERGHVGPDGATRLADMLRNRGADGGGGGGGARGTGANDKPALTAAVVDVALVNMNLGVSGSQAIASVLRDCGALRSLRLSHCGLLKVHTLHECTHHTTATATDTTTANASRRSTLFSVVGGRASAHPCAQ